MGFYISWWYTLSTFLLWVFIFVVQYAASKIERRVKKNDGDISDNRIQVIHDIIVGIKTIKCFGWEEIFIKKLEKCRAQYVQMKQSVRIFRIATASIVMVAPYLGIYIIQFGEWMQSKKL